MKMPAKIKYLLPILLSIFSLQVLAQGGNSPYTILGLGEVNSKGSVRNQAMGGVGVSMGNGLFSNPINPALLVFTQLTSFEANYSATIKNLESVDAKQKNTDANISFLSFSFPINKVWTMGVGLRPLTTVNYTISQFEKIPHAPAFASYEYSGSGGISQVYFSHGFHIKGGLSLGLSFNYNFGTINNESKAAIDDGSNEYVVGAFERTSYSKITFQPGLHYRLKLNDKTAINFGATYEQKADFNTIYFESTQRRTLEGIKISTDTLAFEEGSKITYPSSYILGASLEKRGKYLIGIDYEIQNWSEYKDNKGENPLGDTYRISMGGEWTPDYSSVSSYFKRVTYRAGIKIEQLPWVVNNTRLDDMAVHLGISLPVSRGFSNISLAFAAGLIDVNQEKLIKEQYFKFNLGLTINDRWFIRRKVN